MFWVLLRNCFDHKPITILFSKMESLNHCWLFVHACCFLFILRQSILPKTYWVISMLYWPSSYILNREKSKITTKTIHQKQSISCLYQGVFRCYLTYLVCYVSLSGILCLPHAHDVTSSSYHGRYDVARNKITIIHIKTSALVLHSRVIWYFEHITFPGPKYRSVILSCLWTMIERLLGATLISC